MNATRRKALAKLANEMEMEPFADLMSEVQTLLDEEQEAYDNMPESLQDGDRGQAAQAAIEQMQAAVDALSAAHDSLAEAVSALEEAQA